MTSSINRKIFVPKISTETDHGRHFVQRRSWVEIIDTPNVYRIVLHFCIALYCQLDSVIKLYYVSIFMLLRFCFWFSKILLIYLTEERCAYNQPSLLVSTGFQVQTCSAKANVLHLHKQSINHNYCSFIRVIWCVSEISSRLTDLTQYLVSRYSLSTLFVLIL